VDSRLVDGVARAGGLYASAGIVNKDMVEVLRMTAAAIMDSDDNKYYELCDTLVSLRKLEV